MSCRPEARAASGERRAASGERRAASGVEAQSPLPEAGCCGCRVLRQPDMTSTPPSVPSASTTSMPEDARLESRMAATARCWQAVQSTRELRAEDAAGLIQL